MSDRLVVGQAVPLRGVEKEPPKPVADVAEALAKAVLETGAFRERVKALKEKMLARRSIEIEFLTEPSEAFWRAVESDVIAGRVKVVE